MKRTLRTSAVSLLGAAVAVIGMATAALPAQAATAKSSDCTGGYLARGNGEQDLVGHLGFCPYGDIVMVMDITADGYSVGARVDDGSGKYRYCKASGLGKKKTCNFDLRENRTIKIHGYLSKKGHKTIWLQNYTFDN
ncbi:hypothetical protein [Streptomyces sp. NPDC059398]|uniref:hypothetical protein n=1 Tax=Streptomyces sp. NPDC059398 TaxID=3346820 RepID=UPI0036A72EE7